MRKKSRIFLLLIAVIPAPSLILMPIIAYDTEIRLMYEINDGLFFL